MCKKAISALGATVLCFVLMCSVVLALGQTARTAYVDEKGDMVTFGDIQAEIPLVVSSDTTTLEESGYWGYITGYERPFESLAVSGDVKLAVLDDDSIDVRKLTGEGSSLAIYAGASTGSNSDFTVQGTGVCKIGAIEGVEVTLWGGTFNELPTNGWKLGDSHVFRVADSAATDGYSYSTNFSAGAEVVCCEHSDGNGEDNLVNWYDGKCSRCGKQVYVARVDIGDTYGVASSAADIETRLAAAGGTVKLFCDLDWNYTVPQSKSVTVDLNGYKLNGNFTVDDSAILEVKDTSSNGGGVITKVALGNGAIVISSGKIGTLEVQSNTARLDLKGGSFGNIDLSGATELAFNNLLTIGYAFQSTVNDKEMMDLAELTEKTTIDDVQVVKCNSHNYNNGMCRYCCQACSHTEGISLDDGKCKGCGAQVYVAKVDGVGYKSIFEALEAVTAEKPLVLLVDSDGITLPTKAMALDLNGCKLTSGITMPANGSLVMTDSKGGGYVDSLEAGGAVSIAGGEVGELQFANSLELSGGKIGKLIRVQSATQTIAETLKSGYAFQYTAGEQANRYVAFTTLGEITELENVQVVKCEHGQFESSNKCTYCGSAAGAHLSNAEGTKDLRFVTLAEAVKAAEAGDTVKLLNFEQGEITIEDAPKFTLDISDYAIRKLVVKNKPIILTCTGTQGVVISEVQTEGGVTVGDLLADGWGLYTKPVMDKVWYDKSSTETKLESAYIYKLPIQSISVKADKTAYTYGEQITLTETVTYAEGQSAKYYNWYKVDGDTETEVTEQDITTPGALSVGSYTYRLRVVADGYTATSNDVTFVVNKATLAADKYAAPTANDGLSFDTLPKALVTAGQAPDGCTMQYKVDNGEWSDNIPQVTNAGEYTVYWQILGGTNYYDVTDGAAIAVSVAKKTVSNPKVTVSGSYTYIGSAIEPAVTVADGEDEIPASEYDVSYSNNVKAGTATVTITNKDGGNYIVSGNGSFAIDKADVTLPTGLTGLKGNTLATVDLPDGWAWVTADTVMNAQGDKQFAANYTDKTGNYNNATAVNLTVTVSTKEPKVLTVTMEGWTFGEAAKSPQFTAPDGVTVQILYSYQGAGQPTTTVPTNAGSYTVAVRYETATEIWTGSTTFGIARAELPSPTFGTISEAGKKLSDVTVTTGDLGGTLTWEKGNDTEVLRGESYNWTLAPTDEYANNYKEVSGSVVLWAAPTSSGGGGGKHNKKNDETKTEDKVEDKTDEANKDENADDNANDGDVPEFDDVKPTDYFSEAVQWAAAQKITGGVAERTFGAGESCTRAQLVTFLWRAAGQPNANATEAMSDVPSGSYYADAVAWAFANDIVGGYGDGIFGSEDNITREQMAAILYRYAKLIGMDTTQGGMAVREFADWEQVADWAKAPMQWAVNAGIIKGDDGNTLNPQGTATRAQIVTMLYRMLGGK